MFMLPVVVRYLMMDQVLAVMMMKQVVAVLQMIAFDQLLYH